jgi:hypothetical protein
MEFLGNTILTRRGSRVVLASIDEETGETELIAISWVDRNRRFFVTTTCGIGEGEDVFRKRLRQLDMSGRAPPDRVIIEVAQPKAIATYYKGAGTIDHHNRIRADELWMDRNLATRHWDKRFNLGVLGIICVDACLFFQQVVHADNKKTSCLKFFCKLADELINNNEGIRMTRAAAEQDVGGVVNAANAAIPTVKSTLRFKSGKVKRRNQGRCSIKGCTKYSVYVCSVCTHATDAAQKQFWFCNPTAAEGSDCFAKHIAWHREQENGGGGGN